MDVLEDLVNLKAGFSKRSQCGRRSKELEHFLAASLGTDTEQLAA